MKTRAWPLANLLVLAFLLIITLRASAQSGGPISPPSPADPFSGPHSTTGPLPPRNIALSSGYTPTAQAVTLNVSALLWRDGCGPTAAGMLLDYWVQRGFTRLVQTDINETIASSTGNQNHHVDYALPLDDTTANLLDDCSSTAGCVAHPNDSLADFMYTSRSAYHLRYGWSYFYPVASALDSYVNLINASQGTQYRSVTGTYTIYDSDLWGLLTGEIRARRPAILLVDSDADGSTDHFVTVTGFDIDARGKKWYRLNNTWDLSQNHWFAFAPIAKQVPWGVYGMTTFTLADDSNRLFIPTVRR